MLSTPLICSSMRRRHGLLQRLARRRPDRWPSPDFGRHDARELRHRQSRHRDQPDHHHQMAITIATIGRLMKNSDMHLAAPVRVRVGLRVHQHAVPHLRGPVDDHPSPALRPLVMIHIWPTRSPTSTLRMRDLVLRTDHGHLVGALQFGDGALRHQQRSLIARSHRANAAELARPQNVAGIRECSHDADRSGLRVHLPVGEDDVTRMRITAARSTASVASGTVLRSRGSRD